MNRSFFAYLFLLLVLSGATAVQQEFVAASFDLSAEVNGAAESSQRLVFLLQYISSDYERAVQNGVVIDSLEYGEMRRFAHSLTATYQADRTAHVETLQELQRLEHAITRQDKFANIRTLAASAMARLIKEKNLLVFPLVTPDLANGKELFRDNCVSCHGMQGHGDGPAADTLNPQPRDFTDPARLRAYAPHQFYQALTFGVDGTAMPAFAEALTSEQRWNLAFYLMTLRRDFQPRPPATPVHFTLRQMATKNNVDLAAALSYQYHLPRQQQPPDMQAIIDYFRLHPPELTIEENLAIAEKLLKQSLSAYLRADSAQAIQLAEAAYWQGFEPIERKLLSRVNNKFERTHTEYHWCLEAPGKHQEAKTLVNKLLEILQEIRRQRGFRS